MNGWIEQAQRAREALKTESDELPVLPSYPFPEDPVQAALVWDLCRSGDAIVVMAGDGSKSIVVLLMRYHGARDGR